MNKFSSFLFKTNVEPFTVIPTLESSKYWIHLKLNIFYRNIQEDLLRELEEIHWHAGDLCDNLNNCFAIHLLLFWPYNIIHTITFLIDVSDYFKVKTHSLNTTTTLLKGCIQTVIFLVTIVYFSRTGTLLNKEVRFSVSNHLFHLTRMKIL